VHHPITAFRIWLVSGLFALLALSTFEALAQEDAVKLESREKWNNVAAGSKMEFNYTVKVPAAFKGTVAWTFADAGTKNVFPRGRGEMPIMADAKKPATVKISLDVPSVKDDVILQAQLIVKVIPDGKDEKGATAERTLWIFADDPFYNRTKWFEGLKITLFDSDAKSKTGEALKALKSLKDVKAPFEEARNPAALAAVKEGVLVIGEGVSFKDEAGLAEAMIEAANRGVSVLCLAPKDGSFPLPGADNGLPVPGGLSFARQDIITKLDKRLDALAWAPENLIVARSLSIKTEDGKVVADVVDGAKGWPWLQLEYPDKKARLVVLGFPLIPSWENSPTPRYLLARMLEHVTKLSVSETK
jgi:hypothetical protein